MRSAPAITSPRPAAIDPRQGEGARWMIARAARACSDGLGGPAPRRFRGRDHVGNPAAGTCRNRWVLDERRMQEVGGPFAGLGQVPCVSAAKFVAVRAATDQPSHAEPGDLPLGGFPPAPGFPSNHAASLAGWVRQRLSDRWHLFAMCQNPHLTLVGAGGYEW